jgi:hypothetical protein
MNKNEIAFLIFYEAIAVVDLIGITKFTNVNITNVKTPNKNFTKVNAKV